MFGATFDHALLDEPTAPATEFDHLQNAAALNALSPQRAAMIKPMETWRGRASMRAATPDQLPVAGAAPDRAALQPLLNKLNHGAISEKSVSPPFVRGCLSWAASARAA